MQDEPSLDQIEDYNNNESDEKRQTVKFVVVLLIMIGIIYATVKFSLDGVDDYVGTPEKPGINTTKQY